MARTPDPPPPVEESPTSQLSRTLKGVGSIVAPITLITALMFYFGLQHAHWYFRYFGINHTVMGLTTQDYLLRSADGLFVPLTAVAAAALLLLWAYRLLRSRIPDASRPAARRYGTILAAVLGALTLGIAVVGMIWPDVFLGESALPGLCLAVGVLLLALASNMQWSARADRRRVMPGAVGIIEWAALFLVVGIGLFWAVTNYSAAVGETRAFRTAIELADEPAVVMYTKEPLGMPETTALEVECSGSGATEAAFRFRYEGLKLVLATDTAYFLLPADWPADGGTAIVLPRTESVRLEFMRPELAQAAVC